MDGVLIQAEIAYTAAMRLLPLAPLALLTLLAACATPMPPQAKVGVAPPEMRQGGLSPVVGRDARALIALFGQPDQDQREDQARRLQFAGPACVLDAYLYPPGAGKEPLVTWVDARTPKGDDIDRASCIAALSRR